MLNLLMEIAVSVTQASIWMDMEIVKLATILVTTVTDLIKINVHHVKIMPSTITVFVLAELDSMLMEVETANNVLQDV